MTWLSFALLALGTSRLSRLIVSDSITQPLREWVWQRWPGDTEFGDSEVVDGKLRSGVDVVWVSSAKAWVALKPRFLGKLIECHWCTSVWVGIIVWVGWWFYPDLQWLLAPLALSEVAGLLNDRN